MADIIVPSPPVRRRDPDRDALAQPGPTAPVTARRSGQAHPGDIRLWRRDRLAMCIGGLLRDPVVARAVAAGMIPRERDRPG